MRQATNQQGILQSIKSADSESAVKSFLKKGLAYKGASVGTRNRWGRVADKRLAELASR